MRRRERGAHVGGGLLAGARAELRRTPTNGRYLEAIVQRPCVAADGATPLDGGTVPDAGPYECVLAP